MKESRRLINSLVACGIALAMVSTLAAQTVQGSATFYVSGLTAGSNTFTAKYRGTVGTATFSNRSITVIPLS